MNQRTDYRRLTACPGFGASSDLGCGSRLCRQSNWCEYLVFGKVPAQNTAPSFVISGRWPVDRGNNREIPRLRSFSLSLQKTFATNDREFILLVIPQNREIPWHSHPCGATRPANENLATNSIDCAGLFPVGTGGMTVRVLIKWRRIRYSVCRDLSAPPGCTKCPCHPDRNPDGEFSHRDAFGAVGMEWRDLASRGTDEPY